MTKEIRIHRPQLLATTILGGQVHQFFDCLETSLRELGVIHHVITQKDKHLRRDETYNQIVYHTRKNQPNWLNAKISYLPDFFYLDPRGFSGWSQIGRNDFSPDDINADVAIAYSALLRERYIAPHRTKYELQKFGGGVEEEAPLPDHYNAVFLQVLDDEVLKLKRMTTYDMIAQTIALSAGKDVVLKRHPLCQSPGSRDMIEHFRSEHSNVHITTRNVHEVLTPADKVVCINSGVGFEALLHGKQVIACGRCDYHHGVSQVNRNGDFPSAFHAPKKSDLYLQKYLYWFLSEHLLDIQDEAFTEKLKKILIRQRWIA